MNSVVGAGVGEPHTTHMFLTSVASGPDIYWTRTVLAVLCGAGG